MTALMAFLGAILGAILSGVGLESYKRHRDRQGVASALAGEIFAILQMSEKRNYVQWATQLVQQLEAGEAVKIPDVVAKPIELDPVAAKHVDKIGLLGGNLPEKIATFYHYVMGIRLDLSNLADGKFDYNHTQKANLIKEDLALWAETVALGNGLLSDLHKLAAEAWWPVARINAMIAAIRGTYPSGDQS
jgi:hypothetical protein